MGISSVDLDILIKLKEMGFIPNFPSVIEIGAQQISNDFLSSHPQMELIARQFGALLPPPFPDPLPSSIIHGELEHLNPHAPYARDFWKWLGFTYASIDIDGSPDSIPLDLNFDVVPQHLCGKYHLTTNYGTTEHIANQLNAFKVIHDLTALGGIMLHNLPAQGMLNHGLINYNPKFFWMLARSNGYKLLYADYFGSTSYYELSQNIVDNIFPFNPTIAERKKQYRVADSGIVIALQKVFDTPYVPPLDIPSGTTTNNKLLKKRYWSVFDQDAFLKPGKKWIKRFKSFLRSFSCILER